jgi:plastocyanin
MKVRTLLSAAVLSIGLTGFAFGDVTGKVTFEGKVPARKKINMSAVPACAAKHPGGTMDDESLIVDPKTKAVANVVVSIKDPKGTGKLPEPATIDQKGCQYVPHVLALMVGQKVLVKNDDDFLHNIHGLPQDNTGFNFGQNHDTEGKPLPAGADKTEEFYPVKCDVHPWMSARVAVFSHPFFAVTKPDGTFDIKTEGLQDGEYTVHLQHEKLGEADAKVTVKGGVGEVKPVTMKMEDEGDATPAFPAAKTRLASLSIEEKPCCLDCEKPAVALK